MNRSTLEEARAAKKRALDIYGPLAKVVGVGITQVDGGYAVKVNLRAKPTGGVELPESIEGVPVQLEIVGRIVKR